MNFFTLLIITISMSMEFASGTSLNQSFLFAKHDSLKESKLKIISEILDIQEFQNPIKTIIESQKIIFWANTAQIFPVNDNELIYKEVTTASFTPTTSSNREQHLKVIQEQCQCQFNREKIAGILISHPFKAAKMYFRLGWNNIKTKRIDGLAPPIVIAYHELKHIQDFLRSSEFFFDSAGTLSKKWKNSAEESASLAQNEFVRMLYTKKGLKFKQRSSYGSNEYYYVNDIYSIDPK